MKTVVSEADTMRRLELWGNFTLEEFVDEFVTDVTWEQPGFRFRGRVRDSDQSVSGTAANKKPFYGTVVSLKPTMMLTFHEDHGDRIRMGYSGLEGSFVSLCAELSLDDRFSHGVLADTNPSLCLFVWGPTGRWLAEMDLSDVPDGERSYFDFRDARAATFFRPQMKREFERIGAPLGHRLFRHDWDYLTQDP